MKEIIIASRDSKLALWQINFVKVKLEKELEIAMQNNKANIAVHSLKDVPYELPQGFCLASFMPREDPRDAFVSNKYSSIDDLPQGAVVGTSTVT